MTAMRRPGAHGMHGMVRLARILPDGERHGRYASARPMARPRVLVVDDDQFIRDCVRLALEEEGYEVIAAEHGRAALEYLERLHHAGQRQPALILLDMRMPVMDGWEFARRYRELPVDQAPIVIVTAAADAVGRAAQIGADGVLAKPFDLDELVALVQRFVQGAQIIGGDGAPWMRFRERESLMGG